MKLGINFGAFSEPIVVQLLNQGVSSNSEMIEAWQKSADAITRLNILELLSDSETRAARKRLLKKICKGVKYGKPF